MSEVSRKYKLLSLHTCGKRGHHAVQTCRSDRHKGKPAATLGSVHAQLCSSGCMEPSQTAGIIAFDQHPHRCPPPMLWPTTAPPAVPPLEILHAVDADGDAAGPRVLRAAVRAAGRARRRLRAQAVRQRGDGVVHRRRFFPHVDVCHAGGRGLRHPLTVMGWGAPSFAPQRLASCCHCGSTARCHARTPTPVRHAAADVGLPGRVGRVQRLEERAGPHHSWPLCCTGKQRDSIGTACCIQRGRSPLLLSIAECVAHLAQACQQPC